MRSKSVAALPTWRTPHQAHILWMLLRDTNNTPEFSLTEIAGTVGIAASTVHAEVGRLVTAGILRERRIGRTRLISPNPDHPATAPLAALAALTHGPKAVIAEHFADITARRVVIFGSWAARDAGHDGPPPNDIDVLVLADPPLRDVRQQTFAAAAAVEPELGLPVHAVVRDAASWDDPDDPLVREIRASPHLEVLRS
jgi:predicted nucleotidyltransferase